jgi:flagellar biosynthesis protein FlhF
MVVRKFEGPNLEAALKLVKEAFGSEALILSTTEIKKGWFQKPVMEVTAAKPEERPKVVEETSKALTEADLERIFPHRRYSEESDPSSHASYASEKPRAKLRATPNTKPLRVSPIYEENEAYFVKKGFPSSDAKAFALRLTSDYPAEEIRKPKRLEALRARLLAPSIRTLGNEVFEMKRSWAAVGPPGSGKTTLLVKLAIYLRRVGNKVHLSTVDSRKLLAREELIGYARLIGADGEGDGRDNRVDLLDTSAFRWSERASVDALKSACCNRSVVLVLDSTMRTTEMLRAIEAATSLAPQAIAFSRFDLVFQTGTIFEVLRQSGLPLLMASTDVRMGEALKFFDPHALSVFLVQDSMGAKPCV